MAYEKLKQQVLEANLALVEAGLVVLTWGNASGADREAGIMAIKPSGVAYNKLTAADIIVLSIKTGEILDGGGRPSSDTPTHLHLYREFTSINGVAHTHSANATAFAQAIRPIPCFGTTHADNFYGEIPVTREMSAEEVEHDYELNTGRVIVERFREGNLDPAHIRGSSTGKSRTFRMGANAGKSCRECDRSRVRGADGIVRVVTGDRISNPFPRTCSTNTFFASTAQRRIMASRKHEARGMNEELSRTPDVAVIFDMDGVLVLTEEAHWQSWLEAAQAAKRGAELRGV